MTTLIIARHGNTFEAGETPRRVGARTDLPLTEKGREQASAIGHWLKDNRLVPDAAYSSHLQRTKETAEIAVRAAGHPQYVYALDIFNEIDYGPDENQTEEDVLARIGAQALKDWDERAVVPDGWQAEPGEIIHNWQGFAEQILRDTAMPPHLTSPHGGEGYEGLGHPPLAEVGRGGATGEVILVVTSNGIARFAPYITGDFEGFSKNHKIKISTGALCVLQYIDGQWIIKEWNVKP